MKAPRALAALGTTLVLAGTAVLSAAQTPVWAAPAAAKPSPAPAALAAKAGARIVAERPAFLHASAGEAFTPVKAASFDSIQYLPYERTYAGLPVIGGDFVLVVDNAGRLLSKSVALTKPIGTISVTPKVDKAKAEALARHQLRTVDKVTSNRLVVYALGGPARLAWETKVAGTGAQGPSSLSVYTDARTGALLKAQEKVMRGTGTGAWNGPKPLTLSTTFDPASNTYSLRDGEYANLACYDYDSEELFTKSTDVWGNNNKKSTETGCVDAMYGSHAEARMLHDWLQRDGMDASGGAWPIAVGLDDINAYYHSGDEPYVVIGYNVAGQWIGSLDVIAHEMGHGIDDHTPGGISNGGTAEFIADTFGAATEWYVNEPKPYDVPDFTVGEQINLIGKGPIRDMAKPSKLGAPDCYSSRVPDMEIHDAAGPGNHWFYLLAEGTNPTDGQPKSPTCNKSTLTGIGVRNAMRILYNAMLRKTTASSYKNYRLWTLQAAKELFPTSCVQFNKVKAAWDAVKVPAKSGEPTCSAYEAAFQANTSSLFAVGGLPIGDLGLGLMPGTSPSIVNLSNGGFQIAFQANTGFLWTTGEAGTFDTGLGMMAGTSPAITALPKGGYQIAFQANTGKLWTTGTPGTRDWNLAMKAGTSPAITKLSNGKTEIAFQASTGKLWTVGAANHNAWSVTMRAGTSPSITALAKNGYKVAVQASSGKLWTAGTPGVKNSGLSMKAGTSPAITTLTSGNTQIAYQGSNGHLWTVTPGSTRDTGLGLLAGTSPAIARQSNKRYVIVFQANTGNLWTAGSVGAADLGLGLAPGTSPTVTAD